MTTYKILGWDDSINNAILFTPWSIIHFLIGYIGMAYVNYFDINKELGMFILFILHTIHELKDWYFSYLYKGSQNAFTKWSSGNSIYNCFGDTIVFTLGVALAINHTYSTTKMIIMTVLFLLLSYIFAENIDNGLG